MQRATTPQFYNIKEVWEDLLLLINWEIVSEHLQAAKKKYIFLYNKAFENIMHSINDNCQ